MALQSHYKTGDKTNNSDPLDVPPALDLTKQFHILNLIQFPRQVGATPASWCPGTGVLLPESHLLLSCRRGLMPGDAIVSLRNSVLPPETAHSILIISFKIWKSKW